MKSRLDNILVSRSMVSSRSQAESYIKLGKVSVDGIVLTKAGFQVRDDAKIDLDVEQQYVSRAGHKLASVAEEFYVDFTDSVVLDVGSSTGGFTDYALQHGASYVYAVDVGTNQLHTSLRGDSRIELHEKTDIRSFKSPKKPIDFVVIDVSFISLREIIPHLVDNLISPTTTILAMVKPQFEATRDQVNKGVVKNKSVRRKILDDFESWVSNSLVVLDKRDSSIAGAKGNVERFYKLRLPKSKR